MHHTGGYSSFINASTPFCLSVAMDGDSSLTNILETTSILLSPLLLNCQSLTTGLICSQRIKSVAESISEYVRYLALYPGLSH